MARCREEKLLPKFWVYGKVMENLFLVRKFSSSGAENVYFEKI